MKHKTNKKINIVKHNKKSYVSIKDGDELTATEVLKVWEFIDPDRQKRVGDILSDFNKKYSGEDKLVYQLLNTLEKFGMIEIEKINDTYRRA